MPIRLDFSSLSHAYRTGAASPTSVAATVLDRIEDQPDDGVWITVVPRDQTLVRAGDLERLTPTEIAGLPLFGLPFSVKDCIDVAGLPTTAACPDYAHTPEASSPVVDRLIAAGAILIGKTNLDQFATGLVGTRSPYGIPRNPFDPAYIPGGSSSGAAVSVSSGLVSFAIGTDTGGSGRVPASFNNVVGIKPSRGLLSLRGAIGTSRSLDCLSVFGLTVADATTVRHVAEGFDSQDPWSRQALPARSIPKRFRFAVPDEAFLDFLGDSDNEEIFRRAIDSLVELGGAPIRIDYSPILEINKLLFEGAYLAERTASIGPFVTTNPEALHPVTRTVLAGADRYSGADAFIALHRLQALRRRADLTLAGTDLLAVPTTPTIWTIAQLDEDPIGRNSALGRYTNFVNFLDLAAVAVPMGFRSNGLPAGLTLAGPAFTDDALADLAGRFQRHLALPLGATGIPLPQQS